MVSDAVAQRAHTGHSCDPREVSPDRVAPYPQRSQPPPPTDRNGIIPGTLVTGRDARPHRSSDQSDQPSPGAPFQVVCSELATDQPRRSARMSLTAHCKAPCTMPGDFGWQISGRGPWFCPLYFSASPNAPPMWYHSKVTLDSLQVGSTMTAPSSTQVVLFEPGPYSP